MASKGSVKLQKIKLRQKGANEISCNEMNGAKPAPKSRKDFRTKLERKCAIFASLAQIIMQCSQEKYQVLANRRVSKLRVQV